MSYAYRIMPGSMGVEYDLPNGYMVQVMCTAPDRATYYVFATNPYNGQQVLTRPTVEGGCITSDLEAFVDAVASEPPYDPPVPDGVWT